ncbi:MAG: glycosyltransferase family 2 protein [Atopobiaceae bacterium]|nr:glycosyltransferase family 2 protein [Atopobiaceae bacterium]
MAKLDILMATYNGERFVAEQIESVRWQTFEDWRLLVLDDCSSDSTKDIVRLYEQRDRRIEVVPSEDRLGGAAKSFMRLLSLSDAPYCMFCDQDDVWLDDKIAVELEEIKRLEKRWGEGTPLVVFGDMYVVDASLEVLAESFHAYTGIDATRTTLRQLISYNVAPGCAMLLNAKARELALRARDFERIFLHDWWVMLAASEFGATSNVQRPLLLYRQTGSNLMGAVKRRLTVRPISPKERVEEELLSARQARLFLDTFEDELSPSTIRMLDQYSSAYESDSFLIGLARLAKSGCWKAGFRRKLGQVRALFFRAKGARR